MEKILSSLNPEQLNSVKYFNGSILVLAGAGSGKTKVLTTRIAWLIKEHNIGMNEVLAVTLPIKLLKKC